MSVPTGLNYLFYNAEYLTYRSTGEDRLVLAPLSPNDPNQEWRLEGEADGELRTVQCGSCSSPLGTSDFVLNWAGAVAPTTEPALFNFTFMVSRDYRISLANPQNDPWWAVQRVDGSSPRLLLHAGRYDPFLIAAVDPVSPTNTTSIPPGTSVSQISASQTTSNQLSTHTLSTTVSPGPTSTVAVVSASGGLSSGAKAALGSSIPIGVIGLVLGALGLRRKRSKARAKAAVLSPEVEMGDEGEVEEEKVGNAEPRELVSV